MTKKEKLKLQGSLVAAGAAGMLVKKADADTLVAEGLAETNTAIAPDANGMVLTRATDKLTSAPAPVAAVPAEKPQFEILSGIVAPVSKRGGMREEVYPFSRLELGQSFAVVANAGETGKQVVARFNSTVSSATRRYAVPATDGKTRTTKKGAVVPVLVPTRKFALYSVTAGDKTNTGFTEPATGARVVRTA